MCESCVVMMTPAGLNIAHVKVFCYFGITFFASLTFLRFTFQRRCNFELSRLFFMGVTKLGEELVKELQNYTFEKKIECYVKFISFILSKLFFTNEKKYQLFLD